MKGYKGKIGFYKNIERGYLVVHPLHDKDPEGVFPKEDYAYLGVSIDVDVEFKDTRQQEVESIDEQIKQTRAELEARINALLGKKQELLALEGS
jgi:hypothetical protein